MTWWQALVAVVIMFGCVWLADWLKRKWEGRR